MVFQLTPWEDAWSAKRIILPYMTLKIIKRWKKNRLMLICFHLQQEKLIELSVSKFAKMKSPLLSLLVKIWSKINKNPINYSCLKERSLMELIDLFSKRELSYLRSKRWITCACNSISRSQKSRVNFRTLYFLLKKTKSCNLITWQKSLELCVISQHQSLSNHNSFL